MIAYIVAGAIFGVGCYFTARLITAPRGSSEWYVFLCAVLGLLGIMSGLVGMFFLLGARS